MAAGYLPSPGESSKPNNRNSIDEAKLGGLGKGAISLVVMVVKETMKIMVGDSKWPSQGGSRENGHHLSD